MKKCLNNENWEYEAEKNKPIHTQPKWSKLMQKIIVVAHYYTVDDVNNVFIRWYELRKT